MEDYNVKLQKLLLAVTGKEDVFEIPLSDFNEREKISFEKVRGSIRLINKMIVTPEESEEFIDKVLSTDLP